MNAHEGLTWHVAEWVVRRQEEPLPPGLHRHARRMVLDHLAGVVASSVGPVSHAVATHVARTYPGDAATAVGHGRSSILGAAVLNGTNGHGIEADEGYTPGSMHPTSVVLPAVFAVAEQTGAGPERVLKAAVTGMELACRIAAAGHPATRNRHFHNTPLGGVFGAAAAVAALNGGSVAEVANALGIAGSHAGGLFAFLNGSAEVKRLHPGKAARDGIVSADLAAAGLTGPTTVLEGPEGYFAAFAGEPGVDWFPGRITDGLGAEWVLENTYVKPYPCCRHLHGAIDAAIALREEHRFAPEAVTAVRVGTFAIAANHNGTVLDTVLDAQLSLPFTVAVALRRGAVTLTDFAEDQRFDAENRKLMETVAVEVDDAANAAYPRSGRPAEVTVTLADGASVRHRVEQPYGEPSNPVSDSALEDKVRALCEPVIGEKETARLIQAVWAFENLDFLACADAAVRSGSGRSRGE
ncbi:MmgE/PrpD family protein [Amycolatopsis sp. La24]|uniref:MmgE/PrpD family protein n=1 Tax=Amycolatopsis sp. La24 TaxID=3028304 RepID=UPI0023AE8ECB|nr:MmgE/PrpD family protein [Amycolatopsis sp. La24]